MKGRAIEDHALHLRALPLALALPLNTPYQHSRLAPSDCTHGNSSLGADVEKKPQPRTQGKMSEVIYTSSDYQAVFGTVMGGTWANTILFAVECYFLYVRLFEGSREGLATQVGMLAILLIDSAATACGYATVWSTSSISYRRA